MTKIIFITANTGIVDGGYGGAERSRKIVDAFKDYDVKVLMASINNQVNKSKTINGVEYVHIQEDRTIANAVAQLSRKSYNNNIDLAMYSMRSKLSKINSGIRKHAEGADIIIADHVGTAGIISELNPKAYVIYSSHNAEADLALQMYPDNLGNVELMTEMEKSIIDASSHILYCSNDDLEKIQSSYDIKSKALVYVPNGADSQNNPSQRLTINSKDIIFIGSGHPPNVEAAKSIVEIAKQLPDYRFHIIGNCVEKSETTKFPSNYIVHGFMDDRLVSMMFENSFAFLNPIKSGSGTHLKLMKALSHNIPIISSTVGMRGLTDKEISDVSILANTNEEVIEAIEALSNPKTYDKLTQNASKISKQFEWTKIQNDLVESLKSILGYPEPPKKILIYSIIRNNGQHIDRYYDQIFEIVGTLRKHSFYLSIYENDSNDATKQKLMSKDWSFLEGFSLISENIGTKHFGPVKEAERVENLAKARNIALLAGGFLDKVDYVLMTEGDNEYSVQSVSNLLNFDNKEPGFDIVSAVSLRRSNHMNHYDWWATRTTAQYSGSSEIPKDFKSKSHGEFYSTSNGLCLYRAKPFKDGIRYGWINKVTKEADCEMVVVCQEFRDKGYDKIFIDYESLSIH